MNCRNQISPRLCHPIIYGTWRIASGRTHHRSRSCTRHLSGHLILGHLLVEPRPALLPQLQSRRCWDCVLKPGSRICRLGCNIQISCKEARAVEEKRQCSSGVRGAFSFYFFHPKYPEQKLTEESCNEVVWNRCSNLLLNLKGMITVGQGSVFSVIIDLSPLLAQKHDLLRRHLQLSLAENYRVSSKVSVYFCVSVKTIRYGRLRQDTVS